MELFITGAFLDLYLIFLIFSILNSPILDELH